jgi:aminomethyltransferase
VALPDKYAERAGELVDAKVVDMPFRESVNPNTREVLKAQGRDAAI